MNAPYSQNVFFETIKNIVNFTYSLVFFLVILVINFFFFSLMLSILFFGKKAQSGFYFMGLIFGFIYFFSLYLKGLHNRKISSIGSFIIEGVNTLGSIFFFFLFLNYYLDVFKEINNIFLSIWNWSLLSTKLGPSILFLVVSLSLLYIAVFLLSVLKEKFIISLSLLIISSIAFTNFGLEFIFNFSDFLYLNFEWLFGVSIAWLHFSYLLFEFKRIFKKERPKNPLFLVWFFDWYKSAYVEIQPSISNKE